MGRYVKFNVPLETLIEQKTTEAMRRKMESIVTSLHAELMAATPVWSGLAVRNWNVSVGSPDYTVHEVIGDPEPWDSGTNRMPRGVEPQRAANEAASRAGVDLGLFADPFQRFYISNGAPHIVDLEYGLLPTEATSRTPPDGMTVYAVTKVKAKERIS